MNLELESTPTVWGFISVPMPLLGMVCGVLVGTSGQGVLWRGHPLDGIGYGVGTWVAFCLFGLIAAGISRAHNEDRPKLTLAGFVLNGILPAILLSSALSYLFGWLNDWLMHWML